MIVLPDGENRMIVASFVLTQYYRVTEGQTDGWRDRHGRRIYSTAVLCQRCTVTSDFLTAAEDRTVQDILQRGC